MSRCYGFGVIRDGGCRVRNIGGRAFFLDAVEARIFQCVFGLILL